MAAVVLARKLARLREATMSCRSRRTSCPSTSPFLRPRCVHARGPVCAWLAVVIVCRARGVRNQREPLKSHALRTLRPAVGPLLKAPARARWREHGVVGDGKKGGRSCQQRASHARGCEFAGERTGETREGVDGQNGMGAGDPIATTRIAPLLGLDTQKRDGRCDGGGGVPDTDAGGSGCWQQSGCVRGVKVDEC